MKLDISQKSGGEKTPRLCFHSHQDALDFADHVVKDSNEWMASHNVNVAEGYVNGDVDIVARVHFGGADGVHDFILSRIPSGVDYSQRARQRPEATKNHSVQTSRQRTHHVVFVHVSGMINCPKDRVASTVRHEPAHDRYDIRGNIFTPPLDETFKLLGVISEREVGTPGMTDPRCLRGGVPSVIQSGPEVLQGIRGDVAEHIRNIPSELDLELFTKAVRVYLNSMGPWLVVDESIPLRFKIGNVLLCAR